MTPRLILAITLIIIPLVVTVRYGLACWLKPFATCTACEGTGQQHTAILARPRPCRRCRGVRVRLRWGRRAYNHLRRRYTAATAKGDHR